MIKEPLLERLLRHKMNDEELRVWNELADEIMSKFAKRDFVALDKKVIKDKLRTEIPYCAWRGYSAQDGYYEVVDGDRGNYYITMNAATRETAIFEMISDIIHDMSYNYLLTTKKRFEKQDISEWHYYEEYDCIRDGRIIHHTVENAQWKYDATYDYRKRWFELALSMAGELMTEEEFACEIRKYQDSLNRHFERPFWVFDRGAMQFVPVE